MELVRLILVFGHLLGVAALLGGAAVQLRAAAKQVNALVVRGVIAQIVTGILLVAARTLEDLPTNAPKYAVKLAVTLAVAVLVFSNRRRPALSGGQYSAILASTVGNVAVAVFWTQPNAWRFAALAYAVGGCRRGPRVGLPGRAG